MNVFAAMPSAIFVTGMLADVFRFSVFVTVEVVSLPIFTEETVVV